MKRKRVAGTLFATLIMLVFSQGVAGAESKPTPANATVSLKISHSDSAAVSNFSNLRTHKLARAGASKAASEAVLKPGRPGLVKSLAMKGAANVNTPVVPSPGFYPADLSYFGGAVLATATTHDIYVNGTMDNGGDPGIFLTSWRHSQLVHVLDQYVGSTADDRYPAGTAAKLEYPIFTTLGDNDLILMLHAAASTLGTGYGHVYNIFLPQGVDFCEGSSCYSPDNPSTFAFCAFHGSVDFAGIGHVLFTLEPYQDVVGCQVEQPSPNGSLIDSTASVLSHEMSETITDPDGDAWLAFNSLAVAGDEIGDLCQSTDPAQPYFLNPITDLNGTNYAVQIEYSNNYHACANTP